MLVAWIGAGALAAQTCRPNPDVPGWPVNTRGAMSSVAVGDVSTAPGREVVLVEGERVAVVSAAGEELSSTFIPGVFSRVPSFGNLDGDPTLEIVLGGEDGLYVLDQGVLTRITSEESALRPVPLEDVDGDGRLDLVDVERTSGRVHVRNASGSDLPGWPVAPLVTDGRSAVVAGPPAVGDLDRDGRPEVVVALKDERTATAPTIFALGFDGVVRWSWTVPDDYRFYTGNSEDGLWFDDLVLGDVDDDGFLEVVYLHDGSNLRTEAESHTWAVLDHEGAPQAVWQLPRDSMRLGAGQLDLALADLDRDGDFEILHAGENWDRAFAGFVFAWHHDGSLVEGFPVALDREPVTTPLVADVDGDGFPDVVTSPGRFGLEQTPIFGWNARGRALDCWPKLLRRRRQISALLATPLPRTVLTDVDGDGRLDLVGRIGSGEIHVVDLQVPAGQEVVDWPTFRQNVRRTGRLDRVDLKRLPAPLPFCKRLGDSRFPVDACR